MTFFNPMVDKETGEIVTRGMDDWQKGYLKALEDASDLLEDLKGDYIEADEDGDDEWGAVPIIDECINHIDGHLYEAAAGFQDDTYEDSDGDTDMATYEGLFSSLREHREKLHQMHPDWFDPEAVRRKAAENEAQVERARHCGPDYCEIERGDSHE